MTEKELMQAVVELAQLLKWLVYHTYDSRRSNAGFPDLVMVRGEEIIFAELKSERGKVSAAQQTWLQALGEARCYYGELGVYVWRPADWLDGTIERTLKG